MSRVCVLALGGALLIANAVTALAQIPSPPPGRAYAFEVASVKPSAPDEKLRVFDFKPTGSLTARNLTLHRLIAAAYGTPFPIPLPDERIVGGPEWLGTARFAVEARSARPPDAATAARDIGFMLRTLLADRFGLRVRLEPRSQRVYALVRAPGPRKPGVTLRPTESECATNSSGCGLGGGAGRMELRGAPLDLVVFALAEAVGRPVVNQTGLEGLFDGSLEWAPSPEETQAVFGGQAGDARDPQVGASIFTAIEEQLGLKLQDARAPIETLVITHADLPAPN
jgi:bla regulator protein blaR1